MQFTQFSPSMTSGNQKWKGAAPSFVNKAEFNRVTRVGSIMGVINSFETNIKMIESRRIKEAIT